MCSPAEQALEMVSFAPMVMVRVLVAQTVAETQLERFEAQEQSDLILQTSRHSCYHH